MTTEEHALQIIAALSIAADYSQADHVLSKAKTEHPVQFKDIFTSLEEKIENLSPLECNSLQWSIYRYALMCVRKYISAAQPAC
jgi:hypothetical protein